MRLPLRRPDTWLPSQLRDNHLRFFNCHAVQKKAVPEERLRVRSERLVRPESTPQQLAARVQESNAQIGLAAAFFAGAFLATAFFAEGSLAGVFLTASFFAATFSVALAIARLTVSSTTFWPTPLSTAFLTDSNFNLLDSFLALALFASHAEIPR